MAPPIPARSAADVAVKLAAVLDTWRATGCVTENPDQHEMVAMQFLEDAERAL